MKPVTELLKQRDGTLWHIRPNDTVFEALQALAEHGVGALMVMEGGALVGVFSERDYTRKIALQGRSSKDTTVGDIMTRNVISVGPSTGTRACMSLMSEKKIRQQQAGIARATRAIWTEVGSAAVADGGGQLLNSRHPSLTGHCGGRPW